MTKLNKDDDVGVCVGFGGVVYGSIGVDGAATYKM